MLTDEEYRNVKALSRMPLETIMPKNDQTTALMLSMCASLVLIVDIMEKIQAQSATALERGLSAMDKAETERDEIMAQFEARVKARRETPGI